MSRADWRGVTIADMMAEQLKPYATSHNIRVEGPEIVLKADAIQTLSMVIHELATNAAKYGALSVPQGCVVVSWQRDKGGLAMRLCSNGASRVGPK